MLDANSVSTPLSTSDVLSLDDGSPPTDATIYRQVIGSLYYLNFTSPDICSEVNNSPNSNTRHILKIGKKQRGFYVIWKEQ